MSTTIAFALLGFGAPGLGLLLARWLTVDDTMASIRRHDEVRSVLAEVTGRTGHRAR